MTIDTERLKTDAAYWRECGAPEDATYFDTESEFFFDEGGYWSEGYYRMSHNLPRVYPRFIPRPQSEWVDGLPPVGCECEIAASTKYLTVRYPEGAKVKIYARFIDDRGVELFAFVDEAGKVGGVATAKCFRLIRTAEQRQREELSEVVAHASVLKGGTILEEWQYDCIADAVMKFYEERYNLDSKP